MILRSSHFLTLVSLGSGISVDSSHSLCSWLVSYIWFNNLIITLIWWLLKSFRSLALKRFFSLQPPNCCWHFLWCAFWFWSCYALKKSFYCIFDVNELFHVLSPSTKLLSFSAIVLGIQYYTNILCPSNSSRFLYFFVHSFTIQCPEFCHFTSLHQIRSILSLFICWLPSLVHTLRVPSVIFISEK